MNRGFLLFEVLVAVFISAALLGVLFYLLSTDLQSLKRENEEIKAYQALQDFLRQRLSSSEDVEKFLKDLETSGSQKIYYEGHLLKWSFVAFKPFSDAYLRNIKVHGLEKFWDELLALEGREHFRIEIIKVVLERDHKEILQIFLSPQALRSKVSSKEPPPQSRPRGIPFFGKFEGRSSRK